MDRILRTLIAQGSKKSFCCVSYVQRSVKVKVSLTPTHECTFNFFRQQIENHFIFCLLLSTSATSYTEQLERILKPTLLHNNGRDTNANN